MYPRPMFDTISQRDTEHIPAHKDFREKYFQGFKLQKGESLETSATTSV